MLMPWPVWPDENALAALVKYKPQTVDSPLVREEKPDSANKSIR